MPLGGLALANSLATAVEAAGLLTLMHHKLSWLEGRHILIGSAQAVLAAAIMGLVIWGWLGLTSERAAWLVGVGGVIIGGLVYGLIIMALKVPEVQSVYNLVRRRLSLAYK
jgi:putative peptidoglycan lipid II flippase